MLNWDELNEDTYWVHRDALAHVSYPAWDRYRQLPTEHAIYMAERYDRLMSWWPGNLLKEGK